MKNFRLNLLAAIMPLMFADAAANQAGAGGPAPDAEGKKKGQGAVDPTVIGKRRKLGLATVAHMSAVKAKNQKGIDAAMLEAEVALTENGYENLKPQAERLADVSTRLAQAIKDGDGDAIQRLGKEFAAVKAGRNYVAPKPKAAKTEAKTEGGATAK